MSTQIGLLSDIHANYGALRQALDVFAAHGVDEIICGGDLVEKGSDGDRVVAAIRDNNIPCVMGNHDQNMAGTTRWDLVPPIYRLTEESVTYLKGLPHTLSFNWEFSSIKLAHGTPYSNTEYLFHYAQPDLIRLVAQEADANVLVVGHTHVPMRLRCGITWIVNPGSVCKNGTGDSGTCAVLTVPNLTFTVYELETSEPVDFIRKVIKPF